VVVRGLGVPYRLALGPTVKARPNVLGQKIKETYIMK